MTTELTELFSHLPGILVAYGIIAAGALSPGPAVLAIMGTSLSAGRQHGLTMTAGVITGSLFWGMISAAGLGAVLATYGQLLIVLKVLGGLYLLWLASKAFRSARLPDDTTQETTENRHTSLRQQYMRGLLIHLTNPKAVFGWMAAIALGLSPDAPVWIAFVIVTGGAFVSLICHAGYAIAFSTTTMMNFYTRTRRAIQYTFAAVFGMAGLKLLADR